jgi:elongation factor G
MKDIPLDSVRNFVVAGHTGSGKTALLDALLFKLGVSDRQGDTAAGTSACDWTDEEKARKITIWAKPFDALWKHKGASPLRLVMLDTPGYADFAGQMLSASAVADAALLTVDATSGVQVGTVRAWRRAEALGLPRAIAITGIDKDNADFDGTLEAIRGHWGAKCEPITLPAADKKSVLDVFTSDDPRAAEVRARLTDAAAESSDELIEKVLGGEELTADELAGGLRASAIAGGFVPVFAVSGKAMVGLDELLGGLRKFFPSPLDRPGKDKDGNEIAPAADAPLVAQVFRSINDSFGQLTLARVWGGTFKGNSEVLNVQKGEKERIGAITTINGRKQTEVPEANAGDIIAIAKMKVTGMNDTLAAPGSTVETAPVVFPQAVVFFAVAPKNQGDDDKLGAGLKRVAEDDPTLVVQRNDETHELILSGMGDVQLDVAVERMKARSKVEVVLSTPKIAYKETVTALGEGHYKHKKQSGGRGQYGEVYLKIEPMKEGVEHWFVDGIVGTCIPRNFLPAIEKGLVDGMTRGAVAGYPVVDTMVTVYDGSYHEVDSSEIAFKIASRAAFKDGMAKAKPVLLEPIMTVRVTVPPDCMGTCQGDLTHRRGRILGMETDEGMQVLVADVPQAEMAKYSSELRSMTAGRGSFEMSFARYETVPGNVTAKIVAEAAKNKAEDEDA